MVEATISEYQEGLVDQATTIVWRNYNIRALPVYRHTLGSIIMQPGFSILPASHQ